MLAYFAQTPPGTFQEAREAYRAIGLAIRAEVLHQTGHEPMQFSTPDGRITGNEPAKRFKIGVYRAPLFATNGEENDAEGH